MTLERGQIWSLAGNGRQHEKRAVLIVQAQALLDAEHPTALIVPLSANVVSDAAPLRVRIPAIGKLRLDTDAMIDQLRAIDVRALGDAPLGKVPQPLLETITTALRDVLDAASSQPTRM